MNEGRIWLYVNPSVGLPIFFLVWVAGTALMVHLAVLNNTTWYPAFLQGGAVAAAPAEAAAPAMEAAAPAADAMAPAAEAPAAAAPAEAAK